MNILAKEVTVIGDVHGCYKTLLALVDKIKIQFPGTQIAFCGDLVDRGPDSRAVVEFVYSNGYKCVKGNHEFMMYTDLDKTTEYPGSWEFNGGRETLESYEEFPEALNRHCIWMQNLPHYLEFCNCRNENGDMLVVSHSSIQGYWQNKDNEAENIMWNREPVSTAAGYHQGIFNIFGHTPTPEPQIGKFHANVDTGCVFKRVHYGKLTGLHFPSMTVIQQENIE
jgi:serine/threonine protein phosphatase 1